MEIFGQITKLEAMKKMHSVCVFFRICRKFEFLVSQGNVATCIEVGSVMGFVANFTCFPAV